TGTGRSRLDRFARVLSARQRPRSPSARRKDRTAHGGLHGGVRRPVLAPSTHLGRSDGPERMEKSEMDTMRLHMLQAALLASGLPRALATVVGRLHRARRTPLLALVVLAIGATQTQAAHAATFDVPCDPFALRSVMATVNSNRAADSLSLAPSCVYLLTETMSVASDGGQPVQIEGRGATPRR